MTSLILAIAALTAAVVAILLQLRTASHLQAELQDAPTARNVNELRLRVEDLEADNAALHERFTRSAKREHMETARAARAQQRGAVAEARELLDKQLQSGEPKAAAAAATRAPADAEALRAQLRAAHLSPPSKPS